MTSSTGPKRGARGGRSVANHDGDGEWTALETTPDDTGPDEGTQTPEIGTATPVPDTTTDDSEPAGFDLVVLVVLFVSTVVIFSLALVVARRRS